MVVKRQLYHQTDEESYLEWSESKNNLLMELLSGWFIIITIIYQSISTCPTCLDRQTGRSTDRWATLCNFQAIYQRSLGRSVTLVHIINNKAKANKDPAFHHERTRPGKSVTKFWLSVTNHSMNPRRTRPTITPIWICHTKQLKS